MYVPFRVYGIWFGYLLDINAQVLQPSTQLKSQLELAISKVEACDLAVTNATLLAPTNLLNAGETIQFHFEVFNTGKGDARGSWYDAIYLTRFPALGPLDIKLSSEPRPTELTPQSFYRASYELQLPISLQSGTYFILFVADSLKVTNDIDFDNNQNFIQIEISQQPATDVFIQNVSVSVTENNTINFSWSFSANSEVDAFKCDSYYLNPVDYLMSNVEISSGTCARFVIKRLETSVFESVSVRKDLVIPMIIDGSYSGIVKTLTNLAETNFDNNVGVSNESVEIVVEELKLDEEIEIILEINSNKLYKFIPSFSMSAFKVTLSTNSTSAFNDIFIGDNRKVPSENTFIARSKLPFSYNQTAIIKNVKPSIYYVLIKSFLGTENMIGNTGLNLIKLRVQEIKNIDVSLIYPSQLSMLGPVTFKFSGVFLTKKIEICFSKQNESMLTFCASQVYIVSEEIIYATFESVDQLSEEDLLDVIINKILIENKTIRVIRGEIGKAETKLKIERPIYTLNQTAVARLTITNLGDTDVLTHIGLISTLDIFSSDLDSQEPSYRIVTINNQPYASYPFDHLIAFNDQGLGGVIQARMTLTIRLEIRPASSSVLGRYNLYFHLIDSHENFLFKFLRSKIDNYKIRGVSSSSWSMLSNAFLRKVESSQVQRKLVYDTLNALSAHKIKAFRFDELISYHIKRFDNPLMDKGIIFVFNLRNLNYKMIYFLILKTSC